MTTTTVPAMGKVSVRVEFPDAAEEPVNVEVPFTLASPFDRNAARDLGAVISEALEVLVTVEVEEVA